MNADQAYAIIEIAMEFIDNYVDVDDGSDGKPQPNKAMQVHQGLGEILAWLEKLG